MKRSFLFTRILIAGFLVLLMAPCWAFGQDAGTSFSQQELDQMLAPVALYPDSLLAQVLIAATYPDQVMEANSWLKSNPGLQGEALNAALDKMNWDLSVKALAPFPQVLAMMAQEPDWTQKLGEAFLGQQAAVMDSVQKLRLKAREAGNLKSSPEQKVVVKGDTIEVEPVNPELVYVPRYDPVVVYGAWWWPTYPPLAYYPVWPGVAIGAVGIGFGFWGAVPVGPVWGWGWGGWGWANHTVNVNINRTVNINSTRNVGFTRNSIRTGNLHHMAAQGRIGSGRAAAAARGGAFHGATGAGQRGMAGRGAGAARPSAASVSQGLKGGGAGAGAGSRGTAATRGGGSRAGGAGGTAGNVSRGGGHGAGGAGGAAGHVSRGGGNRAGGAGAHAIGGAARSGGKAGGGAPKGGGGGGAKGGAPPKHK